MHVNSWANWLLIWIRALCRIKITAKKHLNDLILCLARSLSPHFSLLLSFVSVFFPIHPNGFVNENLRLKQIQYSQEEFSDGAGRERAIDEEESLCLAVFKLFKEIPNYIANVDFHEKAPSRQSQHFIHQPCPKDGDHQSSVVSLTPCFSLHKQYCFQSERCNKERSCTLLDSPHSLNTASWRLQGQSQNSCQMQWGLGCCFRSLKPM